LTTFLIAYFLTGSFSTSVAIGGMEAIVKTFIYYFHERAWNRFRIRKET
jgi:uncharacterized membrane protein